MDSAVAARGSAVNPTLILPPHHRIGARPSGETDMWRRDSGLAAAAALAVYAWIHLLPGTEHAAAQLRDIVVKQHAMQDQLDLIDEDPRGSSPVAPTGTDAGRLGAAHSQLRGPDLLDGVLPTGGDGM